MAKLIGPVNIRLLVSRSGPALQLWGDSGTEITTSFVTNLGTPLHQLILVFETVEFRVASFDVVKNLVQKCPVWFQFEEV